MKRCTYCGKEYPDETTACTLDGQPLEPVKLPEPPKPTKPQPPPLLLKNPIASLKAHLSVKDAIGQDCEHFDEVCENFKAKLTEVLGKADIAAEWVESPDTCQVRVSVVRVDPGDSDVRFFVGLLPVVGHFCGPAGTFEADAELSFMGQTRKLQMAESDRTSSGGTKYVLLAASGKAALRLATDILSLVKSGRKPDAAV